METRETLRDELIAVLGATRELSPDGDALLAEAFLQRVERELPSRGKDGQHSGSTTRNPSKLVRHILLAILAVLLLGPALAFTAKGFVVHLFGNTSYIWSVLLVALGVVLSVYLEHHAVQVRITQRKRLRSH